MPKSPEYRSGVLLPDRSGTPLLWQLNGPVIRATLKARVLLYSVLDLIQHTDQLSAHFIRYFRRPILQGSQQILHFFFF